MGIVMSCEIMTHSLLLVYCVMFLCLFNIKCIMAVGTVMGSSSIVHVTDSNKITHSVQWVLRQCTALFRRLLVAVMFDEFYFKSY
jgi:hypothetical protein